MKQLGKSFLGFFATAALVLSAALLTSCSEKDNDDGGNSGAAEFDGSSIVGRWQLVSIMTDYTDRNDGTHTVGETIEESDEATREYTAGGAFRVYFREGGSVAESYTYDDATHVLDMTVMGDLERGTVTTLTANRLVYYARYENTSHSTTVDTMKFVRL